MGHLPQKKLKFSKRSHISYLLQFTTVMKQEKYFSSAGPRDVYLLIQILNEIIIIFLDENAEQISNQMTTCSLNLRESLTRHCMMVFSKLKHIFGSYNLASCRQDKGCCWRQLYFERLNHIKQMISRITMSNHSKFLILIQKMNY